MLILGMWDIQDMGCWGCGGCGMFAGMWDADLQNAQKYQLYHQVKLISMTILLVKKYYLLINNK